MHEFLSISIHFHLHKIWRVVTKYNTLQWGARNEQRLGREVSYTAVFGKRDPLAIVTLVLIGPFDCCWYSMRERKRKREKQKAHSIIWFISVCLCVAFALIVECVQMWMNDALKFWLANHKKNFARPRFSSCGPTLVALLARSSWPLRDLRRGDFRSSFLELREMLLQFLRVMPNPVIKGVTLCSLSDSRQLVFRHWWIFGAYLFLLLVPLSSFPLLVMLPTLNLRAQTLKDLYIINTNFLPLSVLTIG